MSLFETDYSSSSSDGGSDQDYEDRTSLKMNNYAFISFTLDRLAYYEGNRGQQLIVDIDDVKVLDGIVMDRGDEGDDTMKVFGWDTWFQTDENGKLDEDIDAEEVPSRHSEKFGTNNFSYSLENAVWEEDEPMELGNLVMWAGNSTKNRTLLKVVTPNGHDAIEDKEDDYNWINTDDLELRDDLKGRRIILSYEKVSWDPDDNDSDEPITYTDAKILDAETFAGITMMNSDSGSSSSSDSGSSGSLGSSESGETDLADGIPSELDNIIGFMANTYETEPENVEKLVKGELNASHSMDDVDIGAVVDEIESRM